MGNCYVCGSETVGLCEDCFLRYETENEQKIETLQKQIDVLSAQLKLFDAKFRALALHPPLVKEV